MVCSLVESEIQWYISIKLMVALPVKTDDSSHFQSLWKRLEVSCIRACLSTAINPRMLDVTHIPKHREES